MKLFSKLFSSFVFYSRVIVSFITKGFSDVPPSDNLLSDNEFYYSINRIFTKNKVKKMYFVTELPRLLDEGFLHDLKYSIESRQNTYNRTNSTNEKCELVDIVTADPYALDFSTFKNRSRMLMWKRRYESAIAEGYDRTELDDLVTSREVLDKSDRNRWMIESWLFVRRAKEVEKSEFCKTNIILELVADSDEMLKECEKVLKDFMFSRDIKYKEIFLQTNDYYKSFSPAGNARDSLLAKMNPPTILNDDIITSFDMPTHGVVGDATGLYFGTDIHTGNPIFYDITKGSDAQNFLITADTGQGKSNYVKGLYSYVDLLGLNSIMLDYEGDEYSYLGDLYDASVIKVRGEKSRYFNTIAIGDLTGDPNIDGDLKRDAISVTERVFSLLLDDHKGMTAHEKSLYNDCVNRVYEKFDVTDDPSTWINSKKITYFHLYGELEVMSKEDQYISDYGNHIKDMVIKLRTYFEHGAINRSMFENPINIDELLGSRHIIFSFGMKGMDESLIDKKELALKQLFVGYITTLVSNYNKSRGNLTVIYFEELQRYLTHEHSSSVVANITSGGRKRNMIVFLITNTPTQLMSALESGKDSSLGDHAAAIMGRVNGFVIGSLKNAETDSLIKYFSLEDCRDDLYLINRGGSMKYSFMVNYKGEASVVKYLFHPELLSTPLYATRTDKKKDE